MDVLGSVENPALCSHSFIFSNGFILLRVAICRKTKMHEMNASSSVSHG